MCKKVDAWCNDPSGEPRDPPEVGRRFRNDGDMQPGIGRISRGEHRAYRRRILCYSNGKRPASSRTPPAYAGRGAASAPSCHTYSRSTGVRSRTFPCVSRDTNVSLREIQQRETIK